MNAAAGSATLYYDPDGYETAPGQLILGRRAAGQSFLAGLARHSTAPAMRGWVMQAEHKARFSAQLRDLGWTREIEVSAMADTSALTAAPTLFVPGPGLSDFAWKRSFFGHERWSLCGITHTLASAGALDGIAAWLTTPVQPWDAVICTSRVARDVIKTLLESQSEWLRRRTGARNFPLPRLPLIPLGLDSTAFAFSAQQKAVARRDIGADDDTVVILFAGRLAFHAKAHPLVLYRALEAVSQRLAAGAGTIKIKLVEFGMHPNEDMARAYRSARSEVAPHLDALWLDGSDPDNVARAWAGADIFVSLSDCIQETFGLTPVEAMAAGLPAVVSDWDGYKDTVRDGVDGFRIPSHQPAGGNGFDLAARHAMGIDSYDMYCGHAGQFTAIDGEAATEALWRLASDPELRRRMGESGRARAAATFDWSAIIPRYEALWAELAEDRRSLPRLDAAPAAAGWPARGDPFTLFSSFPTGVIDHDTTLALVLPLDDARTRHKRLRALDMTSFAQAVLPPEPLVDAILAALAPGPCKISDLAAAVAASNTAVIRAGAWLMKLGLLRRAS